MDTKRKSTVAHLRPNRSEYDFDADNLPLEDPEEIIRSSAESDADRLTRIRKRKALAALRAARYKD